VKRIKRDFKHFEDAKEVEKVYELIKELKQNNEDGLLDSRYLSRTLLSALGELGYTVPSDTPTNVFKCGLCSTRKLS
jgi:hypothetical protein